MLFCLLLWYVPSGWHDVRFICTGHAQIDTYVRSMCSGHTQIDTYVRYMCSGHTQITTYVGQGSCLLCVLLSLSALLLYLCLLEKVSLVIAECIERRDWIATQTSTNQIDHAHRPDEHRYHMMAILDKCSKHFRLTS